MIDPVHNDPKPQSPESSPVRDRSYQEYVEAKKREAELIWNIKSRLPELEVLLREIEEHSGMEDYFYRFYHQSFKVYHAQKLTVKLVQTFEREAIVVKFQCTVSTFVIFATFFHILEITPAKGK